MRTLAPKLLAIGALLCAGIGIFVAGTLSLAHSGGRVLPCGAGTGCETVAASDSSQVFGVPVAYFGLAAYAALLALAVLSGFSRLSATSIRLAFIIAAAGFAVSGYLSYESVVVLKAICPWCLASAITMTVLLLIWTARQRSTAVDIPGSIQAAISLVLALAAVGGAFKLASSSPKQWIDLRLLRSLDRETLVPPDAQSLGNPQAKIVLVEFTDFACPACRQIREPIMRLVSHQPGIRLVFRHLPQPELKGHEASMDGAVCAEIAAESGKFWPFTESAFSIPEPPSTTDYKKLLERLLGREPSEAQSAPNGKAVQRVQRDLDLAHRLGLHLTPTFIVLSPELPAIAATSLDIKQTLQDPKILKYIVQP